MKNESTRKRGGGSILHAIPAAIDKCEFFIEWLIRICGWSAILFVLAIFAFVFKEAWPPIGPRPRVQVTALNERGESDSTKLLDAATWTLGDSKIGYRTRTEGSGYDGMLSFENAEAGAYTFSFAKDVLVSARASSKSGLTVDTTKSGQIPSADKPYLIGTKVTLIDATVDVSTEEAANEDAADEEGTNEDIGVTYEIVAEGNDNMEGGRISIGSSAARAPIDKGPGDVVEIETADGIQRQRILSVEYPTRILSVTVPAGDAAASGGDPAEVTTVLTSGWLDGGEFLTSANWRPDSETNPQYGILALMVGTGCVTVLSTLLSVPLGLGAAVYLSEFCTGKIRETLKIIIELLAAIPSIVWGFIGVVVLGPILIKYTGQPIGVNILNGSIILALMSVPVIVSIGEDSLKAVPDSFREAALSLGASRWEVVYKVLFPAAKNGLLAAVLLGVGRAIGETMAVLLCTGHSVRIPTKVTDPVRTMTATIASELGEAVKGGQHYQVLFLIGVVLFGLTFLVNLAADLMVKGVKAQND